MIAGVLVQLSNRNIDRVFDYNIPLELQDKIKIGMRVVVPFAHQHLEGFVLEIKDNSDLDDLKLIEDIVDLDILLSDEQLKLGRDMQKDTMSTLISCYQVMLPKALKASFGKGVSKKYDTFYKFGDVKLDKVNPTQQRIIDIVEKNGEIKRNDAINISSSSLNTLVKKGVLVPFKREHYRVNYDNKLVKPHTLTSEQKEVVDSILNDNSKNTFLIYGVTGSGKTEVYMELIDYYLKQGKTAIMLVPEISLTPQMVKRFGDRFGNKIAALHSALSDGEKYDEYRRIYRGEVDIVIGARSAVFAPLKNLGIIIIDEEHSDSYKQDASNPRYSTLDVAHHRAEYNDAKVVLGSATPTLETFARSLKGVYKLLTLPHRVNGSHLPLVNIVDMNKELRYSKGHFSRVMLDKIKEKKDRREQIILLLNRRGYSSFVTCKNCGYTVKCPHCDITLTYHKTSNNLRCHYCGYATRFDKVCPECGEKAMTDLGVGTQKIEEELLKFIPGIRVLRMDFDTTSKKGMHEKLITSFREHEADVLLGTQIVAKGLDFSSVTLVGVMNADTSLNIPDFRSSENTFSLLSQVAGRSGRSKNKGEVIIQTYNPEHYAIKFAKNHDYLGFFKEEMNIRRSLKYPPYYFLIYIRVSGRDDKLVLKEASRIRNTINNRLESTIVLGPTPCNIFKRNFMYRYSIVLKYKKDEDLYKLLLKIIDYYKSNRKITIDLDFNPIHFD